MCMKKKVFVIVILNLFLSIFLFSNESFFDNYVYQSWNSFGTLNGTSTTDIVQTKDGYINIGTYEGLARFDGLTFTNYELVRAKPVKPMSHSPPRRGRASPPQKPLPQRQSSQQSDLQQFSFPQYEPMVDDDVSFVPVSSSSEHRDSSFVPISSLGFPPSGQTPSSNISATSEQDSSFASRSASNYGQPAPSSNILQPHHSDYSSCFQL